MNFIKKYILSMPAMAIGLLLFAISIGTATFIENDYGTPTAQAEVYHATWFYGLWVLLSANLVFNMIRMKMHTKPFAMVTIFHTAFLLILVGAAVTHYVGYEGTLHIRNGATNDKMLSSKAYVQVVAKAINNPKATPYTFEKNVLFSKLSKNSFSDSFTAGDKKVEVTLHKTLASVAYGLVEDTKSGIPMIEMMVASNSGPETVLLKKGDIFENADVVLDFDSNYTSSKPIIKIFMKDGVMHFSNPMDVMTLNMDTKEQGALHPAKDNTFNLRTLHVVGNTRFVLRNFMEKAKRGLVSKEDDVRRKMRQNYPTALYLTIKIGDESKDVTVLGSENSVGDTTNITMDGLNLALSFGPKFIKLPFKVKLESFDLQRYPGSMAPSSYSSHVIVIDTKNNVTMPYHIFMNHVLDYKGFRLFQSSYDSDEQGTILSVNHDPGSLPTYIGYALLAFGLFGSFFVKRGRFQGLRKKLSKLESEKSALGFALVVMFALFQPHANAMQGVDIKPDPKGTAMFSMVLAKQNAQPELVVVAQGEQLARGQVNFNFTTKTTIDMGRLNLSIKNGKLWASHGDELFSMSMKTQKQKMIEPSLNTELTTGTLYGIGEYSFVIRKILDKAKKVKTQLHLPKKPEQAKQAVVKPIPAIEANKFGRLLSQKQGGRLVPIDSLSLDILHKVYKKGSFEGLNSNQVMLGMMSQPDVWYKKDIIKIEHKQVAKLLGIDETKEYASYSDFYPEDAQGLYTLEQYVNDARQKPAKKRNKLDKALLKVDERVHIIGAVFQGALLNIFPKPNDGTNKWYNIPDVVKSFSKPDKDAVITLLRDYFVDLEQAQKDGNYTKASTSMDALIRYQKFHGAMIYPSETIIDLEIAYNKSNIFIILMISYLIVGLLALMLSFTHIIKPFFNMNKVRTVAYWIIGALFVSQTLGLAVRWAISGHAPWSNGYEAIVYVSWATALAGLIVGRKSALALSATAMMSGVILFVAWISAFDPQITNLVPVLKSYWLSIHVSMITGSYGFLGLSALIGFITLMLFIALNDSNTKRISHSIKELNLINEMSMLIGLATLTVGNFLGGVWANESWGRYWGWDSKETWALVSILVYAAVAHMRIIPKVYTQFRFATASLVAFSAILMTFFGVNYYLSGMHSYAKGDPVPVPEWVLPAVITVFVLIMIAKYKQHKFTK